jgi:hypothetical protein
MVPSLRVRPDLLEIALSGHLAQVGGNIARGVGPGPSRDFVRRPVAFLLAGNAPAAGGEVIQWTPVPAGRFGRLRGVRALCLDLKSLGQKRRHAVCMFAIAMRVVGAVVGVEG